MTTTALPLPTRILRESDRTVTFSDMSAQFGDGYEQVAPKGINNKRETWNITWGGITAAEKTTIVAVLDTVGSWGILTWTPCDETVQRKFRLDKSGYKIQVQGNNGIYSVSCTLRQVFDIT